MVPAGVGSCPVGGKWSDNWGRGRGRVKRRSRWVGGVLQQSGGECGQLHGDAQVHLTGQSTNQVCCQSNKYGAW